MEFSFFSDPESDGNLGRAMTNLLITGLSESRYLQVVAGERIHDVEVQMDRLETGVSDVESARQVAQDVRARWVVLGDVAYDEQTLTVTCQLIDAMSSSVLSTQRLTGTGEESVFTLVDSLSVIIEHDLNIPIASQSGVDRDVASLTTHSFQAYKNYLDGLDRLASFDHPGAASRFQKAINYDSTFAMAYYRLSGLAPADQTRKLISSALEYSTDAGRKHQLLIKSRYAWIHGNRADAAALLANYTKRYPDEKRAFLTLRYYLAAVGRYREAIAACESAIEIDSLYATAWNHLAYTHLAASQTDRALVAIERYIALAPNDPNSYDSKAEILLQAGRIEEAMAAFEQALQVDPSFANSAANLAILHLYQGDFDLADRKIDQLVARRPDLLGPYENYFRALSLTYQGRLAEALEILAGIADIKRPFGYSVLGWYSVPVLKARIHWEQRQLPHALEDLEPFAHPGNWDTPPDPYGFFSQYLLLLTEAGLENEVREARAHWSAKFLNQDTSGTFQQLTSGTLAFATGNDNTAAEYFSQVPKSDRGWYGTFMLGRTLLRTGEAARAVLEFEAILSSYWSQKHQWSTWDYKTRYYLALAYEATGRRTDAIEAYRTFLSRLDKADPGIIEVEDARARLSTLTADS
jgi:tetratricopeptide (TPR) repeat protein